MIEVRRQWLSMLVLVGAAACHGGGSSSGAPDATDRPDAAVDAAVDAAPPPAMTLELIAGDLGASGSADGVGAQARFNYPNGLAVDSQGNIYVADRVNLTLRKITPAGEVTTLAGAVGMSGFTDGTGSAARFTSPGALAVDAAGNVYVTDTLADTLRKVTPAGVVSTLAGTGGVRGPFYSLTAVAVDSAGNVDVVDQQTHVLSRVAGNGTVTTFAGSYGTFGDADGTGTSAQFGFADGLAADAAGNVYVADQGNEMIRKVTAGAVVTTLAGHSGVSGTVDGTGTAAELSHPIAITADPAGNVYLAQGDPVTKVFPAIRKITPAGVVTTIVGAPSRSGIQLGTSPGLENPRALAVDGDSLIIADANVVLRLRHAVR